MLEIWFPFDEYYGETALSAVAIGIRSQRALYQYGTICEGGEGRVVRSSFRKINWFFHNSQENGIFWHEQLRIL